jgi:methionyl-tRNA formyltransferase
MDQKRIVILTRDDFEHRYVVNTLSAACAVECTIVDRQPSKMRIRRAVRQSLGHFLSKAARAAILKVIGDDKSRTQALRRLFGKKGEAFDGAHKIESVSGINSNETITVLKQIDPHAILIYGTSVVKDAVLDLAREICLNLHTGISPYYRGASCAFWPIVDNRFDMLGSTIHECTSKIDGGKIFETVKISCEPNDDLHTIFGRTVMAGADAFVRVIERYLAGKLEGTPQDLILGREFRGSDLTIGPELAARRRLAQRRKEMKILTSRSCNSESCR